MQGRAGGAEAQGGEGGHAQAHGLRDVARTTMVVGLCQARDNRWQDAERSLSKAFELDPSNPTIAYNLSEVLYRRGDMERARFYLRRVNALLLGA